MYERKYHGYVDHDGNKVADAEAYKEGQDVDSYNQLQDVWDDATQEWVEATIPNQRIKNDLLNAFATQEGQTYLKKVIEALPKNTDGTITAYRIGAIGGDGPQSYTLSEGMAKTFSNQGTDIPLPGTPGLPKNGYADFGVLPANMVKIDPKGIAAWSPYDAEILVESKFVKTASPSIPKEFEADIVNPIDLHATPEEKVRQLQGLSKENAPLLQRIVDEIHQQTGAEGAVNFKDPEKILEKSQRPSIIEEKPWHGVEHIRDSLRFKSVINHIHDMPKIQQILKDAGVTIIKTDLSKMLMPKQWGFRFGGFDLRMPNGQIIEHYMPIKEVEEAKEAGHQIFEKWRNQTREYIDAHVEEYKADVEKSFTHYYDAFKKGLDRMGQNEDGVAMVIAAMLL